MGSTATDTDKDSVNKSIELALEFLNINKQNFKEPEFNRCSEALLNAFKTKIGKY